MTWPGDKKRSTRRANVHVNLVLDRGASTDAVEQPQGGEGQFARTARQRRT
jgi:hypothetical protein